MNVVQIVRKARLGVDAILPGGNVSSQWTDEEGIAVANTAYDEMWRLFRLARKKWGMRTLTVSSSAFTMDGELYTPSSELSFTSASNNLLLPPDFGDLVRVTSTSATTVRFRPAEIETLYWLEREQESVVPGSVDVRVYFYDIVGNRTLRIVPSIASGGSAVSLSLEYMPLRRPLYISTNGTVTQSTTTLTGSSTTWLTDGIATEDSGNQAELIAGTNSPTSSIINVNRDYPRISAIASDTAATMKLSGTVAASTPSVVAMAPAVPRDMHRWLCDYVSAFMLKKVNPELALKYMEDVTRRMSETIQPVQTRRQLQESPVTEGVEEFHSITHNA